MSQRPIRALLYALAVIAATRCFAAEIKVSTWNFNWLTAPGRARADLPGDVHMRAPADVATLAAYAKKLDADLVAFQEVDGPAAAAQVFDPASYTILTIDEPVVQRVGLAIRKTLTIHKNPDLARLDAEPGEKFRLRYGLDATLSMPHGTSLRILVVHLKTGCQTDRLATSTRPQCALLARQIPPLAAWVAARQAEGTPYMVLGDFNRVFDSPEELGAAMAPMLRTTEGYENPCWDGAAFIDHIFLGGPARDWLVPGSLRVQIFQEIGAQWKEKLSDHCPVSIRLDISK